MRLKPSFHAVNFSGEFGIVTIVSNENNSLTVVFNSVNEENYSYKVTDVTGRTVIAGTMHAAKGLNNLEINKALSEGVYTLTILNVAVSEMRKFLR